MLIPIRHSSLFRNRWLALLWAAGICWTAVEFAAPGSAAANATDNASDATGADDINQVQALVAKLGS